MCDEVELQDFTISEEMIQMAEEEEDLQAMWTEAMLLRSEGEVRCELADELVVFYETSAEWNKCTRRSQNLIRSYHRAGKTDEQIFGNPVWVHNKEKIQRLGSKLATSGLRIKALKMRLQHWAAFCKSTRAMARMNNIKALLYDEGTFKSAIPIWCGDDSEEEMNPALPYDELFKDPICD